MSDWILACGWASDPFSRYCVCASLNGLVLADLFIFFLSTSSNMHSCLKWHPDRHASKSQEDKEYAEAQFKDVQEAFGILDDPQKRRMYDQGMDAEDIQNGGHSHGGGGMGGGMGGIDPSVLFQMFGGGMGGGRRGGGARGGHPHFG